MLRTFLRGLAWTSLLTLAACAPTQPPRTFPAASTPLRAPPVDNWPGQQSDGSVLLPNQWSLSPAGQQVQLGDFPVNMAVHPSSRYVAVLHSGYGTHQVIVVDIAQAAVVSRTDVNEAFYGLEFSKDGTQLFCSGAGEELVRSFKFDHGILTNHHQIKLRDHKTRSIPAGLALDSSARNLFVANVWGHRVTKVQLVPKTLVSDIAVGTNATSLSVVTGKAADFDTEAATKRAQAALFASDPADTFPYACRLDERRQRLYVSLWAQSSVAVVDLRSYQVIARWATQEHPCEMALTRSGKYLFVANANRNTVSVLDTDSGKTTETIWAALYPQSPPGSTPNSLALSPDEKMLFIANADNNMVAVFDISEPGKSRSLGFIPAGWYPTSVRVTPDGQHLLIANGKGLSPSPNPLGPQPGVSSTNRTEQYIAGLLRGTLSIIDLPSRKEFEAQLADYTARVYRCSPLQQDANTSRVAMPGSPIPNEPGSNSPIRYCLYIVKENRTYDQVLGDMPQGNGDPGLCLFPERVSPNHHKLAREFVLLDNFYVDSEVSADGHEWSMGAYASDFVEKMWPMSYGHNRHKKYPYPAEGNFPIAFPAGGYLWDRAREAGISYRSYGEFVNNGKTPEVAATTRMPALRGHFDEWYRGFDLDYPDLKRAERFIAELRRFEAEGEMPRLQILRLPNDHTHGASRGKLTPTALVGDNDLSLGLVVEAVSRSKFWPQTAIFVVEDDAQNGPDHVDAHRTIAFVISPYVKRHSVDSTLYSTSSMLRTIELILGLKPMSQFDAAATPMFKSFQSEPELRPYQALPANVDLRARNPLLGWGSNLKMNFAKEDAADDLLLNETVWRSIRGAQSAMPPPVRAGFVFVRSKDSDD